MNLSPSSSVPRPRRQYEAKLIVLLTIYKTWPHNLNDFGLCRIMRLNIPQPAPGGPVFKFTLEGMATAKEDIKRISPVWYKHAKARIRAEPLRIAILHSRIMQGQLPYFEGDRLPGLVGLNNTLTEMLNKAVHWAAADPSNAYHRQAIRWLQTPPDSTDSDPRDLSPLLQQSAYPSPRPSYLSGSSHQVWTTPECSRHHLERAQLQGQSPAGHSRSQAVGQAQAFPQGADVGQQTPIDSSILGSTPEGRLQSQSQSQSQSPSFYHLPADDISTRAPVAMTPTSAATSIMMEPLGGSPVAYLRNTDDQLSGNDPTTEKRNPRNREAEGEPRSYSRSPSLQPHGPRPMPESSKRKQHKPWKELKEYRRSRSPSVQLMGPRLMRGWPDGLTPVCRQLHKSQEPSQVWQ